MCATVQGCANRDGPSSQYQIQEPAAVKTSSELSRVDINQ